MAGSARGWNGVQVAVLAFIGLCGVLTDGRPDLPRWLQTTAALLSLVALGLACLAVFLVATIAWPLTPDGDADGGTSAANRAARRRGRLRVGALLTFVAVAVMALAASANWWPVGAGAAKAEAPTGAGAGALVVEASDAAGNTWCGRLVDGGAGSIVLVDEGGGIELALARLTGLAPVPHC